MASPMESLEGSMLRSPWITICNVLWGNRLAASQHTIGSKPVPFSSLWPESFIELYSHGGMESSMYDIVKLLLTSSTFGPLDAMLSNNLIEWDTILPGNVTLTHLVCALNSKEGCDRLMTDSPQKTIWDIKDHLDHYPFSVCLSPNFRKTLRKNIKALSKRNKNPIAIEQPLTTEIRSQIFNLASESEGLYDMAVLLQMYDFDINQEKNDDGNLLLHVVANGGLSCLAHMFYLVRYYNADITLPNDRGLTPVHITAMIGDEKMTEVLICVFGAGVNSTDTAKKWTPLHFAARYNCPQLINMLLERGADLRKDDCDGCIPSLVAQKYSSGECFNLLEHHSNGRDERLIQQASEGTLVVRSLYPSDISIVTRDGFTLLMKAVLGNQPKTVRDLLALPTCPKDFTQFKLPGPNEIPSIEDQTKKTALIMAAENGLTECLRILLDGDADPTIFDSFKMLPLHNAVENNHKDCVKCILNHRKGLSGLKLAASLADKNGRADIAHIIRESMQKRQKDIVTPSLFEIARTGNSDELILLIEDDDDVNQSNDVSDWPLYVAAGCGHVEVVKILYESGGSVVKRHRLNLCTPLHAAARGGHVEVIRFLLGFCHSTGSQSAIDRHGNLTQSYLDVNEKNAMQETPLELAACQGHMAVVRLLLDHGAVTTLPDSNGCLLSCPAFCGVQFLIESRRKEQMDKIVRFLMEQKPLKDFRTLWKGPSDFNLRDSHDDTVLMVSAKYSKPDVMDFLLQSAVLYTPDMKIKWNYNKRPFRPVPSATTVPKSDGLEESLPCDMPSRNRDDFHDRRSATAFESSLRLGRRSSYSHRPNRLHRPGYITSDTSGDDDFSFSGNYQTRPVNQLEDRPRNDPPAPRINDNNYVNVTPLRTGPCTPSGLLCLINTYDRCSALHRAIEGNQFKLIPLLLTADPNIVNILDKNSQSALHRACHHNLKKCIAALCNSSVVSIDPMVKDINNKLAEDLVIQPRLKKIVYNYRVKHVKESNPTNRPLPPAPLDNPPLNSNGAVSIEPSNNNIYHQQPLPPVPSQQRRTSYQYTTVPPKQPVDYAPLPTMEEDTRYNEPPPPHVDTTNQRNRQQPRYIAQPRYQIGMANGGDRYSRVQRVHGNSVSDDNSSHYSRLSPPPIPNQIPTNIRNHQSSNNSLEVRVNNLRGVAYDSDSLNESD